MARTKQTARKSTGGLAPRRQLATKAAKLPDEIEEETNENGSDIDNDYKSDEDCYNENDVDEDESNPEEDEDDKIGDGAKSDAVNDNTNGHENVSAQNKSNEETNLKRKGTAVLVTTNKKQCLVEENDEPNGICKEDTIEYCNKTNPVLSDAKVVVEIAETNVNPTNEAPKKVEVVEEVKVEELNKEN